MSTNWVIAVLMFALVSLIIAEAKPTETHKFLEDRRLCSKNLADELMGLCSEYGFNSPEWDNQEMDPSNPGAMMMVGLYKMPVGVADKCCHTKTCNVMELLEYCRPAATS